MRLTPLLRWTMVALSALLQVMIFPTSGPLPAWRSWLAWIALTPLLLAIVALNAAGERVSWRQATLLAYACGILWYAGNCYWIYQTMYLYGGMSKPAALGLLLLFSLYLGLYHALFGLLLWAAARRSVGYGLLAAPFLWVAVELARAHVTSFPWDQLGMSQIEHSGLTALSRTDGVYGISFWIVWVNVALLFACLRLRGWKVVAISTVILSVALIPLPITPVGSGPVRAAVLLQPDLPQSGDAEWFGERYDQQIAKLSALSRQAGQHAQLKPDVVIWPESPAPLMENDPRFQQAATELAKTTRSALILGNVAGGRSADGRAAIFNSASFFTPQGQPAGRYDKIHLVPFGEYVPFKSVFGFASGLTANVGSMSPGHDRVLFHTGAHTYGVFICYESIFADEVRQLARNGADVLVNISDDGWYGDTSAPWQHLNMARMRAIENRRWILRDTNTGVTAAIDPEGRIVAQAPRHTQIAIAVPFGFVSETTFYTRHGDVFAHAVTILAAAMLLFARGNRAKVQQHQSQAQSQQSQK